MSERTVEVSGVTYRAGGKDIVEGVSFHAVAGEFIGVIGPNGAGKSTLLRITGGDLRPSAGGVSLMGESLHGVSPRGLAALRAMLGSHPPDDIPFTVRTVVASGRYRFRGLPGETPEEESESLDRSMAATDVAGLAGRVFATLSTGEQTRVLLARVLAQESPVVLLDEPTASLDLANAEHILSTLSGSTDSTTVIGVIHDLNAAALHCGRLLLMSRGRLVADGAPSDVLDGGLLSEVYAHPIRVVPHPFRDRPLVLVDH